MTALEDILARAARELGPGTSDDDVKEKVLETIEALPEAERRKVLEEMVQLASTTQLAHLRDLGEAATGPGDPEEIV
jgi:hypothetical protein